jgi:hypothetical protein
VKIYCPFVNKFTAGCGNFSDTFEQRVVSVDRTGEVPILREMKVKRKGKAAR